VINVPGSLPQQRLAELGVARVSFGPFIQRAALTRLAELAADLLAGAALPDGIQALN
jgi:2-methylisocitrate lyase-like PEP mutase family enzyme